MGVWLLASSQPRQVPAYSCIGCLFISLSYLDTVRVPDCRALY